MNTIKINVSDVNELDSLITVPLISGEILNGDEIDLHNATTIINVPVVHDEDGTFLNVNNSQGLIITTGEDGTIYLDPSQVALFENAVAANLIPLEDADIGRSGLEPCSSDLPPLNEADTQPLSDINLPQILSLPSESKKATNDNEQNVSPAVGPFKCSRCKKKFDKWIHLQRHERVHDEEKPYRCSMCASAFNMEINLQLHQLLSHNVDDPVCPVCAKRFSRVAGLKAHIMAHEVEENLFCVECGDEFSTQSKLNAHMLKHREEVEKKVYNCKYCVQEFSKASEFRDHIKAHNRIKASLIHRTHKRNIDRSKFTRSCETCGKSFQKPSQLERHLRIHTGEKPFECAKCGRSFNQKGALHLHEMSHNGVKPHICEFCTAAFAQKGNLRAHIKRVHTIIRAGSTAELFSCKECTCVFRKLGALNAHMSRTHSVESMPVDVSGKEVNDVIKQLIDLNGVSTAVPYKENNPLSQNLNEDLLARNSDLLQQAIQNSGLTNEEQNEMAQKGTDDTVNESQGKRIDIRVRVRKVDGVRWHQCCYCTKEFKKPSDLVRHIRVHTHEKPFKCDLCYRSFSVKSTLTSHQRTHFGLKMYSCNVCARLFSTKGSLRVHARLHTGAKPFECHLCDKKFRTSGHRKSHMSSHYEPTLRKKRIAAKKKIVTTVVADNLPDVALEGPLIVTDSGIMKTSLKQTPKEAEEKEELSDRPYRCTHCSRGFIKSSHLKQHLRTHTGERPYRCTVCMKSFISGGVLNVHIKTHSGVKSFKCHSCDASFTTNGSLKRHMGTHSETRPFMCPYCHKTFKAPESCKKHIKCHKHDLAIHAAQGNQISSNDTVMDVSPIPTSLDDMPPPLFPPRLRSRPQRSRSTTPVGGLDSSQDICSPTANGAADVATNTDDTSSKSTEFVEMQLNESFVDSVVVDSSRDLNLTQVTDTVEQLQHQFAEENQQTLSFDHFTSGSFQLPDQLHQTLDINVLGDSFVNSVTGLNVHSDLSSLLNSARPTTTTPIMDVVEPPSIQLPTSSGSSIPTSPSPICQSTSDRGDIAESNKTLIQCSYCDRTYKRLSHLKQHERSHSGEKPFGCNQCNRYFVSMGVLKSHLKTHTGARDFSCHVCQATFTTNGSRNRHMAIHSSSNLYNCDHCTESFRSESHRERHVRRRHLSQYKNEADGEQQIENETAVFNFTKSPKKNKNAIVKFTEEQTVELATQKQDAVSTVSEKILIASAAEKNRVSEIVDKEAELELKPRLAHACDRCPKSFKKPSDLTRHMRIHTGEKPYCCHLCPKKFTVKSTLDSHVITHSQERRFNCHVCDSNFSTKGSLKVHMRLHTGAKPFKCPYCELKFRTSGHRKSHIQTHLKVDKHQSRRLKEKDPEKMDEMDGKEEVLIEVTDVDQIHKENSLMLEAQAISTVFDNELNLQTPVLMPQGFLNVPVSPNGTFLSNITLSIDPSAVAVAGANRQVQLQFSSDVNLPGLITQTIQIDSSLLQQLQEQGNINITLDSMPTTMSSDLNDGTNHQTINKVILEPAGMEMTMNTQQLLPQSCLDDLPEIGRTGTEVNLNITETGEMVTEVSALSRENMSAASSNTIAHICGICNRTYKQARTLKIHLRTHHKEEINRGRTPKVLYCEVCDKTFPNEIQLQRHVKQHSAVANSKHFTCDICNMKFISKSRLQHHAISKHGDLPYKCGICNANFAVKSKMTDHIRKMHQKLPSATETVSFDIFNT